MQKIVGDFEKNDGTGGHSAFKERDFLAEQVETSTELRQSFIYSF